MDVQAFLGFVNFYWRFIWDFSAKARSLFDLTCSKQVWTWSEKKQIAFKDLKTVVTTAPVLVSPQELDLFWIEADSSDFAIGAVLSQQSTMDRKWYPVAFYSKSLSSVVTPYKRLGKISDILHLNNKNNQLERRVQPPKISIRCPVVDSSI